MSSRVALLLPALVVVFSLQACASDSASTDTTASAQTPTASSNTAANGKGDFFGWGDVDYADMSNSLSSVTLLPIRGRLVTEDPDDINDPKVTPLSQVSQDEIEDAQLQVEISSAGKFVDAGTTTTDHEGYIEDVLDVSGLRLAPGRHTVEVFYDGKRAGRFQALMLGADDKVPVVRSDIDLTYLNTNFQTTSAMIDLLKADASKRETLPGMASVYAGLRGDDNIGITFLSGSPRFFKRTLDQKMKLDGVENDGIVLKYVKGLISSNLSSFDFSNIVPALKEQVGYKLYWLLYLRTELPTSTPEVLMGDDSEADFVTYNFYDRILTGQLDDTQLRTQLSSVGVTADWMDKILEQADRVRPMRAAAPVAIYINTTPVPNKTLHVDDWIVPGLTRHHEGAWPLILDMYEEGLVDKNVVASVHQALLDAGESDEQMRQAAADADFLDPATRQATF